MAERTAEDVSGNIFDAATPSALDAMERQRMGDVLFNVEGGGNELDLNDKQFCLYP